MEKCDTCIYRTNEHSCYRCDYLSIMGKSRGCQDPAHCSYYIKGERLDDQPKALPVMGRPKHYAWDLAWKLYHENDSITDREIAEAVGCQPSQISRWRKQNRLALHPERKTKKENEHD